MPNRGLTCHHTSTEMSGTSQPPSQVPAFLRWYSPAQHSVGPEVASSWHRVGQWFRAHFGQWQELVRTMQRNFYPTYSML